VPLKGIGIPTTLVPIFATGIPTSFALFQNYPNPFNPATRIRFAIPKQSQVKIEVLNIIGQKIAVVVDREVAAGAYEVNWQANGASGIYFYRIEATPSDARENRFVEVRKMILLK
jgi:hypothetical protein